MTKRLVQMHIPKSSQTFPFEIEESVVTQAARLPIAVPLEYEGRLITNYLDANFMIRGTEELPLLPGFRLCAPPCKCECPKPIPAWVPATGIKDSSMRQLRQMATTLGLAVSGNAKELIRRIERKQWGY